MRSRAVSLTVLCSRSRRSGPPPASASSEIRRSSSMRSRCLAPGIKLRLGSDNVSSLGSGVFWHKNAHREMRGQPDSSKKQYNAEEQFRAHGSSTLERRFERSHVFRGPNKNEHGAEGHRHGEDGRENGSENHYHRTGIGPFRIGIEKDSATRAKSRTQNSVS